MLGMGGSQRLTRAIGKAKAMELCLTGRTMDADEAERAGLASRIVPADQLLDEALATAATIASMSLPIAMMTKESVNRAFEGTLAEGVRFERRVFHAMVATDDQTEGMTAFVEKRDPDFQVADARAGSRRRRRRRRLETPNCPWSRCSSSGRKYENIDLPGLLQMPEEGLEPPTRGL
jgi:Enoyl-CoA hydratase/isomerase